MSSKGKLFILSGPGGSGKTTLAHMILEAFSNVRQNVSVTTRAPRAGEKEGIDYFFVTSEQFQKKIDQGDFLEYARVFDAWYGSDKTAVFNALNQGKHVILVIDVQGALEVQRQCETVSVFISPPSLDELKLRLEKRGAGEKELQSRMEAAEAEMEMMDHYDYHLVNRHLSETFEQLKKIFIQEGAEN